MADFDVTQLRPGGGGAASVVKSIQRGSAAFTSGDFRRPLLFLPLLWPRRSSLVPRSNSSGAGQTSGHSTIGGRLTDATTITFQRGQSGHEYLVDWQVLELN